MKTIEEKIKHIKSYFTDDVIIRISAYSDADDGEICYTAEALVDINFEQVSLYWISTKNKISDISSSQIFCNGNTIEEALNNLLIECICFSINDYVAQPYGVDENYNK